MEEKWDDREMSRALARAKGVKLAPADIISAAYGEPKNWEHTDEQKRIFVEKHKELSSLLDYPPFSINRQKRRDFTDAVGEESARIHTTGEIDRPFSTIEVKWKDDLDEAMLYRKRYNSPKEAQNAAIEINKMDRYKDEDELYPLYY